MDAPDRKPQICEWRKATAYSGELTDD